jgi:nitrite reductase/ring-hydroxylating ferredoxin subunit
VSEGFTKVAATTEVPEGTMKTFSLGDQQVVVANVGGTYYAIGAICNHREWDLSEGTLEGETIVCAGHGAIWDLKTGEGQFPRPLTPEPVFEVRTEGTELLLRPKSTA